MTYCRFNHSPNNKRKPSTPFTTTMLSRFLVPQVQEKHFWPAISHFDQSSKEIIKRCYSFVQRYRQERSVTYPVLSTKRNRYTNVRTTPSLINSLSINQTTIST